MLSRATVLSEYSQVIFADKDHLSDAFHLEPTTRNPCIQCSMIEASAIE